MLGTSVEAEQSAAAPGWLQRRDPRAKLTGTFALLLCASLVHRPLTLAALYLLLVVVASTTRVRIGKLLRREWLVAGLFTGLVALPAVFITPGPALVRLPGGISVSGPGTEAAARLLLRAVASIHLALLLTQTTPWHHVLRGLRGLGVPALAVMLLSVSHRYIALLVTTAREMLLGREARRVGKISGPEARRQIAASVGTLFIGSQETGEAVFKAMAARGWRGEPRDLAPLAFRAADALLVTGALAIGAAFLLVDRHVF
jgi:cobalt ECF transporter T component CbiQ